MSTATRDLTKNLTNQVTEAVKIVLNLESEEVNPQTQLIADLGAESIDFLDISCELEKLIAKEVDFKEIIKTKAAEGQAGSDLSIEDIVSYLSKHNIPVS